MNYLRILDEKDNIIDHIMVDDNIFNKKQVFEDAQVVNIPQFGGMFEFIYNTDFFEYISNELKNYIKQRHPNISDTYKVKVITKEDYKQYDEKFAHECDFIDYFNSHLAKIDKSTKIDEDILEANGFEDKTWDKEKEFWNNQGIKDFSTWHKDTSDIDGDNYIIIDMNKGVVNKIDAIWGVHIDNEICETIGSIDLSNIWQFNMFMEILGSKFRLES